MRDYRDAKAMAHTLRAILVEKKFTLTHAESLELVAKTLGVKDWNTLAAEIQAGQKPVSSRKGKAAAKSSDNETTLPAVRLRDVVVFPNITSPIFAGREKTIRAIENARTGDCRIFLITQRVPADEHPSAEGLYKVGVVATVLNVATSYEGFLMSFVRGDHRAALVKLTEREDFDLATVERIEEGHDDEDRIQVLSQQLTHDLALYVEAHSADVPIWRTRPPRDNDLSRLADAIAFRLPVPLAEKQRMLETVDVASRIEQLRTLIKQHPKAA